MQKWLMGLSMALVVAGGVAAQAAQEPGKEPPDMNIDAALRQQVIDSIARSLKQSYVFPETAEKMETDLKRRLSSKEYNGITSGRKFAEKLTADLQSVSHDKHLRVRFSDRMLPERTSDGPTAEEIEQQKAFERSVNYGFEKVERLEGNIGYLDLRFFASPQDAGETAAAAMTFLANADALIVDLRKNGGGDPAGVQFLCSYLFEGEPVHLNSLYYRPSDTTQQFWTLPYVPGRRFGKDKPVYVLTSNRTFSGAEEYTYNLKNLKRATIVGETTGGGAHPGGFERLHPHFGMFVPSGRAISPITKTNWEGTGVAPDVVIRAEIALKQAYLLALREAKSRIKDRERAEQLAELTQKAEKELATAKAGK